MQCATIKHHRCSSLENIDVEQQQQSLFDVSILKLQQEQLRHGVEPRLLRFVLINNALRSLQGHMLQIDSGEDSIMRLGGGGEIIRESSDMFFYNTFKNGSLSSLPLSPPTPVKMIKLDNSNSTNQSPLVEHQEAPMTSLCPSHDVLTSPPEEDRVQPAACYEEDFEAGGASGKERRMQNGFNHVHSIESHLGKRSRDWCQGPDDGDGGGGASSRDCSRCRLSELKDLGVGSESLGGSDAKKPCKPPSLIINSTVQKVQNGLNGLSSLNNFLDLDPFPSLPFPPALPPPSSSPLSPPSSALQQTSLHNHHTTHYTSSEDCDKESLTPSPIDFTNVDPTLYDFDTAVLQVESTDSVSALDSQESTSLPNTIPPLPSPMSIAVTITSTTCSSPLIITTPMPSPSSQVHFPLSSSAVVTTESPSQQGNDTSETGITSYLEPEKRCLVSADSMVLATYPPSGGSSGKGGSCSMEAFVRAQNGGDLVLGKDDDLSHNGGPLGDINGRNLPSSPERVVETDCIDEIEHIVKLLMTGQMKGYSKAV